MGLARFGFIAGLRASTSAWGTLPGEPEEVAAEACGEREKGGFAQGGLVGGTGVKPAVRLAVASYQLFCMFTPL